MSSRGGRHCRRAGLPFFAAFAGSSVLGVPLQEFAGRTFGFTGAFVLLTAVATVQADANDGLVLSWAAAFARAFGYLAAFGPGAFDGLLAAAVVAVAFRASAAAAFGTAGVVLGAGLWGCGDSSSAGRRRTTPEVGRQGHSSGGVQISRSTAVL